MHPVTQVVSAKNPKTIIINYDSFKEHKLYRKRVRSTSRIVAHDEECKASPGDYVRIVPCRPVSKTKRFRLDAIIKRFEYNVDEQTGEVAALGALTSAHFNCLWLSVLVCYIATCCKVCAACKK